MTRPRSFDPCLFYRYPIPNTRYRLHERGTGLSSAVCLLLSGFAFFRDCIFRLFPVFAVICVSDLCFPRVSES